MASIANIVRKRRSSLLFSSISHSASAGATDLDSTLLLWMRT